MYFQVFVALASLAAVRVNAARIPHIVDGEPSVAHSKPWLVNVAPQPRLDYQEESGCGGSLIKVPWSENSSDIVLTAAHCVGMAFLKSQPCHGKKKLFERMQVIVSNHNLKQTDLGEKKVNVTDGECHEKWHPALYSNPDIALLKLAEPVFFSDTVKSIELAKKGQRVQPGTVCTIAGWGAVGTSMGDVKFPDVLQELDVKVLDDKECATHSKDYRPEFMVCEKAANGTGHACDGDSGGPLFCEKNGIPVLNGIISFGSAACFNNTNATMHTDVAAMADWIEGEMKKLGPN